MTNKFLVRQNGKFDEQTVIFLVRQIFPPREPKRKNGIFREKKTQVGGIFTNKHTAHFRELDLTKFDNRDTADYGQRVFFGIYFYI